MVVPALLMVCAFSPSALAQAKKPAATTPAKVTPDSVDPDAIAALQRMSAYLRSLKAFQVEATTSRDDVLDNGQKIQSDKVVNMLVRFPDRLRVQLTGPELHRLYLYNGKTLTLFAGLLNYYATVAAPPTLAKLATDIDEKYDLQLPLEDLFTWGTPQSKEKEITSAIDVGPVPIRGITCEHFAFRQKGVDWQVWIQLGDYPLPLKLVLTTTTDEARPEFLASLSWNLAPSYDESAFEFEPPPGAKKITLKEQAAAASGAKK